MSSLFGTWTLVSSGKALWTGTGSNGNTTIAAGLPNIKGTFNKTSGNNCLLNAQTSEITRSGALYISSSSSTKYLSSASSATVVTGIGFNANNYNSIYSDTVTTVQPPAYVVNVWRRTA